MSDDTGRPGGLVVRCDRSGTVAEVLIDTLDTGLERGHAFTQVLGTASIQDALTLLTDADRGRPTRAAVLEFLGDGNGDGDVGPLHVVGCSDGDGHVVVVGAASVDGLPAVVDGTAWSVPTVRDTLHRLSAQARAEVADEDVLSAMSEVNNELAGMHRELASANAELDQLNRRKDEILAMVAHDLRNPLGSVAGFGAALERQLDGGLDATSRQMLTRIQALSRRMLDLVDDLLDTAVIENDTLRLDIESTDLAALLADTVENHRHHATSKGVELALEVDRPELIAWVDAGRLVQVVDNLLSNAIKFSPADVGARVTVAGTIPDADHVAITVRDQGTGLADEQRERLFEPFDQHSRTGTADERGTGLGLAITRSIVDAHHGNIVVDSALGEGSTFTVTLPIRPSLRSPV